MENEDETNSDIDFEKLTDTGPTFTEPQYGWGNQTWDGNTLITTAYYPPSIETVNKKMDDLLKRISVIEQTLLSINNKLETMGREKTGE